MSSDKVEELGYLLLKALPGVVVRRGPFEQLGYTDYQSQLQRCREVYDPFIRPWLSSYRLEVSQPEVRDKLFGFVYRELADHIRDGKIHSATIAFAGGLSSGSPVYDVVLNLVRRAVVDGPEVAARAFVDCTTRTSISFNQFFLLSGIKVEAPFEVFDGITLIPMPESASELPSHLPFIGGLPDRHNRVSVQDVVNKTLVQVEYEVSPIFHRPAESYTFESGPDRHFRIRLKGEDSQQFDLDVLCQALAVAGRCSVRSIMTWTSMLDYEIFDLSITRRIGASGYSATAPLPPRDDPSVLVSRRQLDTINALYTGLAQPSSEPWGRLHIPVDRLMKSMQETNPIDQIIDLGIALEALYVPDSQSEVTFRFALHAAWHLGENKAERKKLRKRFEEIYRARSDVMHTGQLRGRRAKSTFDVQGFVRTAQDLCWQGITSIIEAGEMPHWKDLVMGEDIE